MILIKVLLSINDIGENDDRNNPIIGDELDDLGDDLSSSTVHTGLDKTTNLVIAYRMLFCRALSLRTKRFT